MAYTDKVNLNIPIPVHVVSSIVTVTGDVEVDISGDYVWIGVPTSGKARSLLQVTGASGGVILTSGAVISMLVKSLKTNTGDMFVGFNVSTEMPYSGFGVLLDAGEAWSFDIDNIGRVRVFSSVSGELITYGGVTR